MGQILAKISELITNVTCRFSSRGSYHIIYTQERGEERERLLKSQDSHIITIPREDEDHDQLISRLIISNEIVDEQGLVIEIPDDAYQTVSTYPRKNDNGSRASLEQNSQSSMVSTAAAFKLVSTDAVQKEGMGDQLISRPIITNEIVDDHGLVIEIPDDAYHTASTYPRENENVSRGSLEQNSKSSLVSTDAALKLVDNVAVQKEDVGGQPKKKRCRLSKRERIRIKQYCSSHEILLVGNENGSRASLEQNSHSSLVSTDAALKLVDNVAVQKEDVGGQPKQKKKQASKKKRDKWIKHYCSSHEILLVGEGDFSFSVCLSKAFGSASKMIATSLDSESILKENYEDAMSNINHLKSKGCTILHEVDATVMASHPELSGLKFDRIIYNFPLAGFYNESRRMQLKRNRNLVFKFIRNAKELLKEDGEIHITHKSNTFFREWNLENLAKQNRLKLIEEVEFKLWHYPGYNNKYGFGGNKNFNCNPSKTYKFGLKDVVAAIVPCGANQENLCGANQNKPKDRPQKNALETNALHLLAKEGAGTSETTISEDERSSKSVSWVGPSHGTMEGRRLMELNMQVVW